MPAGVSLYLDGVRFAMAMLVLLGHSGIQLLSNGFLWQLRGFADPAVVVFFVLSGFVIAYVTAKPGSTGRDYALARTARILSVTVPVLALTFLLDAVGQAFNPDLYLALEHSEHSAPAQLFSSLLFLNESWLGHIRPGSNGSYWSMGYEVWYYVAFGLAWFAPPRWRVPGTALALLVAGPAVAGLFPLWLIGVGCYHLCRRLSLGIRAGLAIWLGTLAFAAMFLARIGTGPISGTMYQKPLWAMYPEYLVGFWFALHTLGAWFASPLLGRCLEPFKRPIRRAAGLTFTLYLAHFPVMVLLRAVAPWPAASWQTRALLIFGSIGGVLLIAPFTEYRREAWRMDIARVLATLRLSDSRRGDGTAAANPGVSSAPS